MSKFAENLKTLRIEKNLTQYDLANKLNITKAAISNYENGRRFPDYETLELIADYFNVNIDFLMGREEHPKVDKNIEFIPNMTTTKIKVYGSVPAGVPVTAIEDIQGTVDIPSHWLSSGYDYMGIVVKGDSMFPKYQEGDIVVIRVQPDCENGQDCVVYINGDEATLKKVIKNSDCIILQPMNSEYAPIVVDYNSEDFKILGVVVQLVRYV